jgi:hypothetical protein
MRLIFKGLVLAQLQVLLAAGALAEGPGYEAPPPYMGVPPGPRRHYGPPPAGHVQPQMRRPAHPYGPPAYRGYGHVPPYGRAYGYHRHRPGW